MKLAMRYLSRKENKKCKCGKYPSYAVEENGILKIYYTCGKVVRGDEILEKCNFFWWGGSIYRNIKRN